MQYDAAAFMPALGERFTALRILSAATTWTVRIRMVSGGTGELAGPTLRELPDIYKYMPGIAVFVRFKAASRRSHRIYNILGCIRTIH
jgi:hypothetical protein